MLTLKKLQEETNKYKNTLVLELFEIKLFLGIIEDKYDFYYIYMNNCGGIYLCSCVGMFIPLLDQLHKEQYNYLAGVWNLNNKVKAKEM